MIDPPDWTRPVPFTERTDNDRVIVGCAVGRMYRERLRSTVNHCAVHCPETWRLWYDELPEGCPPHDVQQYAFKIHVMQRAIDAGFHYVMWMDTAFAPVASIEPIWRHVQEHGWYVAPQGDSKLGNWCKDEALRHYGISRDEAMSIPLVYSGLVVLDMQSRIGKQIWLDWQSLCLRGAFDGPHFNSPIIPTKPIYAWERHGYKWIGHCSFDPRCEGHRHDEAALSYVLHSYGCKLETKGWLSLENPASPIIGHKVPDYDVVEMRAAVLSLANIRQQLFGNPQEKERLEALCR